MDIICCICSKRKKNMRAYVPSYISCSRRLLGRPGYACEDCLENQRKVKRVK